jgi:hypothetical protein
MAELIFISDEIINKYDNSPFRIPLKNREGVIVEYALVDEDDFEKVNKYKWCLNSTGYAQGMIEKTNNVRLHFFVFKKPEIDNVIDHIDQDRLNNQKSNLREVSYSINSHNKKKNTNIELSSKYKGVCWNKKQSKWISSCTHGSKTIYLGSFETEEAAAEAYDIYTFKVYDQKAHNNNLVKYEDTHNVNIDDLIIHHSNKYDMPKNIQFNKKDERYYARKSFNKKGYKGRYRATVEEALKDLEEINKKIELLKQEDKEEHNKKEITRTDEGIPFIQVKDIEVLVDEDKWYEFNGMSWYISKDGYVSNSKEGSSMHRIVTNAKKYEIIDHINNKKYDNRNCNLRIASASLNAYNKIKKKNTSSKYFGVHLVKKDGKWIGSISFNGKKYYLGSFEEEIEAAKAYNEKAIELYGENANLNVI